MGTVRRSARPMALPGFHTPGAGFEAPFDMLAACHERVERMLALLARVQQHLVERGCDEAARQAARDVMRYFDLAAPLHHQDEELHVFPPLLAGPDARLRALVQRLVQDHRDMEAAWPAARGVLQAIADRPAPEGTPLAPTQTAALNRFAALYGRHLTDEDRLAYPAAQAALTGDALLAMNQDMMQRRVNPSQFLVGASINGQNGGMNAPDLNKALASQSDLSDLMHAMGEKAKNASAQVARAPAAVKNKALLGLAALLRSQSKPLQAANALDVARAKAAGLAAPLVDRLILSPKTLETVAMGCEQLAAMADVIGEISGMKEQPSGIRVGQMRVPIGVFGMIYESRPSVTIEAASLAIKSGNACILRGGSEAIDSNKALAGLVHQALMGAGLPADTVQLVPSTDREAVGHLITMPQYVDVIIPRGGKGLIERISRDAKVPVIKHLDGNCHVYVDDPCDIAMAVAVADNAKTQKYSPCNASEGLLVARAVAAEFLPKIGAIYAAKGVEMRCDEESQAQLAGVAGAQLTPATEQDWYEEYLAPIISIKVVAGIDEAIAHINKYSSHHTDAILTRDHMHAQQFLREVDSASVMVNTSTRFADGFEFGLGAEIGISTDKFHARGPVGIEGLTSLKYVVLGHGEIRG